MFSRNDGTSKWFVHSWRSEFLFNQPNPDHPTCREFFQEYLRVVEASPEFGSTHRLELHHPHPDDLERFFQIITDRTYIYDYLKPTLQIKFGYVEDACIDILVKFLCTTQCCTSLIFALDTQYYSTEKRLEYYLKLLQAIEMNSNFTFVSFIDFGMQSRPDWLKACLRLLFLRPKLILNDHLSRIKAEPDSPLAIYQDAKSNLSKLRELAINLLERRMEGNGVSIQHDIILLLYTQATLEFFNDIPTNFSEILQAIEIFDEIVHFTYTYPINESLTLGCEQVFKEAAWEKYENLLMTAKQILSEHLNEHITDKEAVETELRRLHEKHLTLLLMRQGPDDGRIAWSIFLTLADAESMESFYHPLAQQFGINGTTFATIAKMMRQQQARIRQHESDRMALKRLLFLPEESAEPASLRRTDGDFACFFRSPIGDKTGGSSSASIPSRDQLNALRETNRPLSQVSL